MRIFLDVKVSDAATIDYALRELADRRRERLLEGRGIMPVEQINALSDLADNIAMQARTKPTHP